MRLAKYVKFREEKFGAVLFETRSEKVYTLNPTAAAVVRETRGRARRARDRVDPEGALRRHRRCGRARSAGVHRRPAREGSAGRNGAVTGRRPSGDHSRDDAGGHGVRRSRRAALRRVADHQRVQPRVPALHRGERPRQGVPRRAEPRAGLRRARAAAGRRRSRTCRSRAASRWSIRISSRWSSTSARAAASSRSRPTAIS